MRYYLHTQINGVLNKDNEGEDFEAPEAAFEVAREVAAKLAADYRRTGRSLNRRDEIVVVDERGEVVGRVSFAEALH
jgi:hypothetical protein